MADNTSKTRSLKNWRTEHKFKIQSVSLTAIVLGSFGVYLALNNSMNVVGAVCFGLVAIGLGLTMWAS